METRKKAPRPVRRGGETNRDTDTEAKRDTDPEAKRDTDPEAKSETEGETDAPKEIGGVRLVRDGQELAALVAALRAGGRFALDTEFIPENRLHPELGLIQVAAPGVEAVVDPLAVKDLGPLFALISDPRILKVVHSGKHDFDIFYRLASAVPANVFDTQIAAAVIGHGKKAQIALRTLVAGFMGRELSKQEQMSNWLQRPLTVRQVEYAIADVRYLLPLRAKLRQRAKALGRLDWLVEEMKPLTDESNYLMPPVEDCYRSLDNTGFTPSQRGSLRELAAWRERRARAANRPRGWILKDAAVRELARRQPRDRKELLQPYHAAAGRRGDLPKGIRRTCSTPAPCSPGRRTRCSRRSPPAPNGRSRSAGPGSRSGGPLPNRWRSCLKPGSSCAPPNTGSPPNCWPPRRNSGRSPPPIRTSPTTCGR